ncbi:MAG TPA: hypothetical protein VK506_01865 [Conexibacter sp.]|nr:hypothetical protein [Conexibacter sp.]
MPAGAARTDATDRIAAKLERLPVQHRSLIAAMRAFGEDFDRAEWTTAFESVDVADVHRVLLVTGSYLALVNNTIEAVKIGAELAQVKPVDGQRGASGIIDALRRDGGISLEQAESFTKIYGTRNSLQHASSEVQAAEIHRHVKLLLRHLPGFVSSFTTWLEQRGIELR